MKTSVKKPRLSSWPFPIHSSPENVSIRNGPAPPAGWKIIFLGWTFVVSQLYWEGGMKRMTFFPAPGARPVGGAFRGWLRPAKSPKRKNPQKPAKERIVFLICDGPGPAGRPGAVKGV